MTLPRRGRIVKLSTLAALAANVVATIAFTGSGNAASYVVHACGPTAGFANHSWSVSNGAPASLTAGSGCGGGGSYAGLYIRGTPGGTNLADGASGSWTFTAPASLRVSAITYRRWLWKQDDDDLRPELGTAEGSVLEGCSIVYPQSRCDIGASGGATTTLTDLSTTSLVMRLGCRLTSGFGCVADGGTVPGAAAILYDAAVTLRDDIPPSWSAPPSGSIYDGGWLRGGRSLTAGGSDASGIQRVFAVVDGADAGHTDQACDFTYARPCANVSGATTLVETAALGDGEHSLRAGLQDAAGNDALTDQATIKVDNTAPASPTVVAPPRLWSADTTPAIGLGIPPSQASPVNDVRYTICDALGVNCGSPQSATDGASSGITVIRPALSEGQHVLRVWLADQAGNADPTSAVSIVAGVDTTVPEAPLDLTAHSAGEAGGYLTWTIPSDTGSPITDAYVQLCSAIGVCDQPMRTPATGAALNPLPPGRYTANVWFVDEAGNTSSGRSAALAFTVPQPNPGTSTTTERTTTTTSAPTTATTPAIADGSAKPPLVRAMPVVTVRARFGPSRRVTVTLTAKAPGPLRVAIDIRDAKGHRLRSIKRTVRLQRGRSTVAFHASKAARRFTARASFTGTSTWLAGSASRSFRLPR